MMEGILTTRNGKELAFRKVDGVWLLWPVHSDFTRGVTHKLPELPHGTVVEFDLENPPRTVGFVPILTSYS